MDKPAEGLARVANCGPQGFDLVVADHVISTEGPAWKGILDRKAAIINLAHASIVKPLREKADKYDGLKDKTYFDEMIREFKKQKADLSIEQLSDCKSSLIETLCAIKEHLDEIEKDRDAWKEKVQVAEVFLADMQKQRDLAEHDADRQAEALKGVQAILLSR